MVLLPQHSSIHTKNPNKDPGFLKQVPNIASEHPQQRQPKLVEELWSCGACLGLTLWVHVLGSRV